MQLIENASAEKLRGAYYTPEDIARFILKWGINGSTTADILEPSCGDGIFLECLYKEQATFRRLIAVEYEKSEAKKAAAIGLKGAKVIAADFHEFCLTTKDRFDLIVGNPPYIRYQYYDAKQQELADEIFKNAGLKRTKLTNAWVTFVVGCCLLLKENGKLGFVVPSELLQVKYAQQLRKFLSSFFNKINIISFEDLVFEDIQQEVVLLLCEKNGTDEHLIEHIEVKDSDDLLSLDPRRLKFPSKKIDFHTDKWTYYFLDKEELDLLQKIRDIHVDTIATHAEVEVGITTGSNDFFTVPQSIVNLYQLQDIAKPMVGRSVQVNSLRFTVDDWQNNADSGAKAYMLVFPPKAHITGNEGVKAYLANGINDGIDKGYKTGIRDYWYVIPSIRQSDALFLRRNNMFPKFVLNEAGAYTTDTMHRVFIHPGVNRRAFLASYYNSLSFAYAEILGRNFGGGCLELMPSEVEGIILPYREENEYLFDQIDKMLREKKTADEILDVTDDIILHKGLGLSKDETALCRSIWHKIMGRRLSRKSVEKEETEETSPTVNRIPQLNLFETLQQYPDTIVKNDLKDISEKTNGLAIDPSKNVLISLVKSDNVEQYLDRSAKIYYTGKKFPSCVALNKLYYFMPYMKKQGIQDLYLIRIARVGTRKEGQPGEDENDIRLVFEIEYIGELFKKYMPINLEIWHTFTDTTIEKLLSKK